MVTTIMGASLVTLHHFEKMKLDEKMPTTLKIYWALWNQSIVFASLISVFYWGFLYKYTHSDLDLHETVNHLTNSVVLLVDLCIVKHPPRYRNVTHTIFVQVLYVAFTAVFQFAGGLNQ
jgi:hypothetical protein